MRTGRRGSRGEKWLTPAAPGHAVDEYLAVRLGLWCRNRGHSQIYLASRPGVRWAGGQAFFAYSTNYLIDTDNAIIVDVEATTAIRQAEVLAESA